MEMEPARMDAAPAMALPVIPTRPPAELRAMVAVMAGGQTAHALMPPEEPAPVTA